MIVVDTNILVPMVLQEDDLPRALFQRDPAWIVPSLWQSEFRNVLAGYVRREGLEADDALDAYVRASLLVREHLPDSGRVLALAATTGCTAYDLEYAAIAIDLNVPLITFDRQLLREFPQVAISPADFIAAH